MKEQVNQFFEQLRISTIRDGMSNKLALLLPGCRARLGSCREECTRYCRCIGGRQSLGAPEPDIALPWNPPPPNLPQPLDARCLVLQVRLQIADQENFLLSDFTRFKSRILDLLKANMGYAILCSTLDKRLSLMHRWHQQACSWQSQACCAEQP